MYLKSGFTNPFVLGGITGLIMGNPSLGLITAGFTVLIWGFRTGMNFITLTTLILVFLTGNINLEIIFLYTLTMAVLVEEDNLFPFLDNKPSYLIVAIFSIVLYPIWKVLLGLIPAEFLNEINIAGIILVITGILLSLVRGRRLIEGKKFEIDRLVQHLLIFVTASLSLNGSWFALPFILVSIYLDEKKEDLKLFLLPSSPLILNALLFSTTFFAAYLLLPLNLLIVVAIVFIPAYFFWKKEVIPLVELVYLAVILGLLAGRLGVLS